MVSLGFPGAASGVTPLSPPLNATEYEEHFNVTDITGSGGVGGWRATPFSGIPIIGDIFAGWNFLITNIGYLLDGLPTILTWIQYSYITDASASFAFFVVANALRAVYALLVTLFLIEYISGRVFTD